MKFNEKLGKEKADSLGGVVLAFVGDAVYSLYVREKLVSEGDYKTGDLNKASSAVVCARAQAVVAKGIYPSLTEEEQSVFRRGRNAKKPTRAKHAAVAEYNLSTALEAVFGYLYLTGKYDRLSELFALAEKFSAGDKGMRSAPEEITGEKTEIRSAATEENAAVNGDEI